MSNIIIPAQIYRAYKVLPKQKGGADFSARFAEYVRIGATAYDWTITYSDQFALIRCAWPKPKDMGNEFEGWFTYLTKAEFSRLEYDSKTGARMIIGESVCPFRHDILSPVAVQTFFEHSSQPRKDGKIELTKRVNPCIMSPILRALETICKRGDIDGRHDATVTIDLGAQPNGAIMMRGFVNPICCSVDALIMPVVM